MGSGCSIHSKNLESLYIITKALKQYSVYENQASQSLLIRYLKMTEIRYIYIQNIILTPQLNLHQMMPTLDWKILRGLVFLFSDHLD